MFLSEFLSGAHDGLLFLYISGNLRHEMAFSIVLLHLLTEELVRGGKPILSSRLAVSRG